MSKHTADTIRNVALAGQRGAGKTSLAEMLLFTGKSIDRLGRVDDGTSTCDFDPDEVQRKMTISTAVAPVEWGKVKVNLLDTPGYSDFVGDVAGAMAVAEAALIVVDAVGGVEVGTETGWDYSRGCMTRAFFINKMDRENADFYRVLGALRERFGNKVVALQMPIGSEDSFEGVVDLVHMMAFKWEGGKMTEGDVPADLADRAQELRESLIEAAAESSDELIEKYFSEGTLSDDEIITGAHAGMKNGSFCPVFCGSSGKTIGAETLLGVIAEQFPSPADAPAREGHKPDSEAGDSRSTADSAFSAIVFKSTADPYVGKLTYFRVVSGEARSDSHMWNATKGHEERVGQIYFLKGKQQEATSSIPAGDIGAVAKLTNTITGDTLCDKASPIVFTSIAFPEPVYSLAISAKSKADEDKLGPALGKLADEDPTFRFHREQETGETLISGLGEAHVDIIIDRLKRKFGVGVDSSTPLIPYRETIQTSAKAQGRHKKQTGGRGQFGDCWVEFEPPVVDIRAKVYDGSFHPVDSSEMAFKLAGVAALNAAAQKAHPVLLEPIVKAEVTVPDEYMGDIIGDLNGKRGRILGMEPTGDGRQVVRALVPLSEMQRYAIDLKSIARGRGSFIIEHGHYEEMPAQSAQAVIDNAKKAQASDE